MKAPNSDTSDTELLTQVAGSDYRAFEQLLNKYWSSVYVHAFNWLKRKDRAEELTQDVFLDLWKQRNSLMSVNNFSSYLFSMTRFATIDALRKKLDVLQAGTGLEEQVRETFYLPDLQLDAKQTNEALMRAIDLLPPKRKNILLLSRVEGMSRARIADTLGISIHTVNAQMTEALRFLRAYLLDNGDIILFLLLAASGSIK